MKSTVWHEVIVPQVFRPKNSFKTAANSSTSRSNNP